MTPFSASSIPPENLHSFHFSHLILTLLPIGQLHCTFNTLILLIDLLPVLPLLSPILQLDLLFLLLDLLPCLLPSLILPLLKPSQKLLPRHRIKLNLNLLLALAGASEAASEVVDAGRHASRRRTSSSPKASAVVLKAAPALFLDSLGRAL